MQCNAQDFGFAVILTVFSTISDFGMVSEVSTILSGLCVLLSEVPVIILLS